MNFKYYVQALTATRTWETRYGFDHQFDALWMLKDVRTGLGGTWRVINRDGDIVAPA